MKTFLSVNFDSQIHSVPAKKKILLALVCIPRLTNKSWSERKHNEDDKYLQNHMKINLYRVKRSRKMKEEEIRDVSHTGNEYSSAYFGY